VLEVSRVAGQVLPKQGYQIPLNQKAQGRMYQLETTAEEIKPVFTERFAVENISESCRSSRYRERTAVREIIISAKAAPSPMTMPVQVKRLVSLRSFAASQGPSRELTIAVGQSQHLYYVIKHGDTLRTRNLGTTVVQQPPQRQPLREEGLGTRWAGLSVRV
jgi:hypothetical protein